MSREYQLTVSRTPPAWVVHVPGLGPVDLQDYSCTDFLVKLEDDGSLTFADHTRSDLSALVLRRALDLCLAHSDEVRVSEP